MYVLLHGVYVAIPGLASLLRGPRIFSEPCRLAFPKVPWGLLSESVANRILIVPQQLIFLKSPSPSLWF